MLHRIAICFLLCKKFNFLWKTNFIKPDINYKHTKYIKVTYKRKHYWTANMMSMQYKTKKHSLNQLHTKKDENEGQAFMKNQEMYRCESSTQVR